MAEVANIETVQASESVADWAALAPAEQQAYVDKLHAGLAAEKSEVAERNGKTPEKREEPPQPGQTRDEMRPRDDAGRFSKTEPPAVNDETPVVGDAAPAAKPDKAKEDDRAWLDADTKDLANAMGLTGDDLAEFGSKAELDRALKIIDRKAYMEAKQPPKPAAESKPAEQQQASAQQQRTDDAIAKLEAFKLDDELGAADAPKLQEAFAAVVAELKEQRAWRAESQRNEQHRAHQSLRSKALESLHSLGHADLFGKPGEKPTKEQVANVEKALEAHFTHGRGLAARGGNPAPTPAFLKAAVNLEFGDQLIEKSKQEHLDALKKQSNRRTGGTTTVPLKLPLNATPLEQNLAALNRNKRILTGADV